eukprot:gene11447-23940_t
MNAPMEYPDGHILDDLKFEMVLRVDVHTHYGLGSLSEMILDWVTILEVFLNMPIFTNFILYLTVTTLVILSFPEIVSETVYVNNRRNLHDPATIKYFQHVYEDDVNISSINISNIIMGYLIQKVQIVAPPNNMRWNHIIAHRSISSHFYDSHQWAEVVRFPTPCLIEGHISEEGFSSGWFGIGPKVPYGCWFLRYPGTGIYVNVGRTIKAKTRYDLMTKLDIDPGLNCTPTNLECRNDEGFCGAALKLGYDSIQVNHYGSFAQYTLPELIICTGKCATVSYNTTCPPGVELRRGLHASKPCTCDDNFKMLNCGNLRNEFKECGFTPITYR